MKRLFDGFRLKNLRKVIKNSSKIEASRYTNNFLFWFSEQIAMIFGNLRLSWAKIELLPNKEIIKNNKEMRSQANSEGGVIFLP